MLDYDLHSLEDFLRLSKMNLTLAERRSLLDNPLLFSSPVGTAEAGIHSTLVDEILGIKVHLIEKELLKKAARLSPTGGMENWGASLHGGNQTWIGLAPDVLQTPYSELKRICEIIKPQSHQGIIDLGAGYGRMALVLQQYNPAVKFLGLEYVKERVEAGSSAFEDFGIENAILRVQDLTMEEFILPVADYYFIYDYGKISHIRRTIKQLAELADQFSFKVIARGKGVRSLIENEHPWLSQVHRPHHEENFSIYSMIF